MDCIHLTGIRGYGYTGALPEEQRLGQWFEVDLTLWVDLAQSGESDLLEHTLDYRDAIATMQHLIKTSRLTLLEKLATMIAESVLKLDRVSQVRVQLIKPAAPIPDFGGKITIDLTRSRS